MFEISGKVTPQGRIEYQYDKACVLEKMLTFHGTTPSLKLSYRLDGLNRIHQAVNDTSGGMLITSYDYETDSSLRSEWSIDGLFDYTMSGNGIRRNASEGISEWQNRSLSYNYDKLYRLGSEGITVSGSGTALSAGTINYDTQLGYGDTAGYDKVGNRQSQAVALSPAVSGFGNVTSVFDKDDWIDPDSDPNKDNPNYDANGNTKTDPSLPGTYAYNFEDRLTSRTGGSVPMVSSVYDADGNLVRKTVNGVTTHFLVDDRNPTGYAQVLEEILFKA